MGWLFECLTVRAYHSAKQWYCMLFCLLPPLHLPPLWYRLSTGNSAALPNRTVSFNKPNNNKWTGHRAKRKIEPWHQTRSIFRPYNEQAVDSFTLPKVGVLCMLWGYILTAVQPSYILIICYRSCATKCIFLLLFDSHEHMGVIWLAHFRYENWLNGIFLNLLSFSFISSECRKSKLMLCKIIPWIKFI